MNCMSFFTCSLLSLKSSDKISSVSCRSKFPSIFSDTKRETMSSGRPINLRDLDTSSIERPARLDGGCHCAVGDRDGQLRVNELEMEYISFVPCSCWASEQSEVSCSLPQIDPDSKSVHIFMAFDFGVLGGKMGQERLCFALDSSIGLSLYISEL